MIHMRKWLIRLTAVLAVLVGYMGLGLPAAQAACPTALTIPHDVMWGTQFIGTDTHVVRCDNGTPSVPGDDYYRPQWWSYTDSSQIRRSYGFNSVGNPIMQWQDDDGDLCNRINGYPEWRVGGVDFIELNGNRCDWPVLFTVVGRADFEFAGDQNFQFSKWR